MNKTALLLVSILFTVIGVIFLTFQTYNIQKDTDALLNRAQIAADREDMLEYLDQLIVNLQKMNLTEGHLAVIFKKADNDLALQYKTIQRLHERLESIKDIPKSDTAYQVALDDIRGTIREVPNPAGGVIWVRYGCAFMWIMIFVWGAWAVYLFFSEVLA